MAAQPSVAHSPDALGQAISVLGEGAIATAKHFFTAKHFSAREARFALPTAKHFVNNQICLKSHREPVFF